MKKFIIIFISIISLISCSNDMENIDIRSFKEDLIKEMINNFRNINNETRTNSIVEVIAVDTKYYQIVSDTIIETLVTRSDEDVFEINTAIIKNEDNYGYAVLSIDERLNKIYFYTENGNLSDTAFIAPLKSYIDTVPFFAKDEIINPDRFNVNTKSTNADIKIGPIVPYEWGQKAPFNNYASECNVGDCDGHMPMGCVTTATAQAIATIGSFKGTIYGNQNIDFKSLPQYGYLANSAQSQQLSRFFYEVAICCQVMFGCGGSSSTLKASYQYLKDLGYLCGYSEGNIDITQLTAELQKGFPHLMRGGDDSGGSGHMWIVDGISTSNGGYYYHCNWGWDGTSDGDVYGNPYTFGNQSTYSKNLAHIYIVAKPV